MNDPIINCLKKAIESEYNKIAVQEIEECTKRIRERMAETTTGIVLNLMRTVQIDKLGDKIIIEVCLPENKSKKEPS